MRGDAKRLLCLCVASALMIAATVLPTAAHAAAPNDDAGTDAALPGSITPSYPPVPEAPEIDGAPLQDYLNSAEYIERLVTYLIGYETWIGLCVDAEPQDRVRTWMVTDPVALPGADPLTGPQWIEVVEIEGCGRRYQRMVYATVADDKTVFHARLPGDSRTDPLVQHAAVTDLRRRFSEIAWERGCDRADHARVIAGEVEEGWPQETENRWRENWVVHTCEGVATVPVIFTRGEGGVVTHEWQMD